MNHNAGALVILRLTRLGTRHFELGMPCGRLLFGTAIQMRGFIEAAKGMKHSQRSTYGTVYAIDACERKTGGS